MENVKRMRKKGRTFKCQEKGSGAELKRNKSLVPIPTSVSLRHHNRDGERGIGWRFSGGGTLVRPFIHFLYL